MAGTEHGDQPPGATHPDSRFADPESLLASDLPTDEKRRLLHTWQREEEALIRAGGEGMQGGDNPMLGRVKRALDVLDQRS